MREKGPADFVTDADVASQEAIQQVINDAFPNHAFYGEEGSDGSVRPDPNKICWVCDPLDGTTNYLHDFPCYAVSVGVVLGQELLAGAIFDPLRDEMFATGKGQGSWVDDTPIKTADCSQLSDALVALSLPAGVSLESPDVNDLMQIIDRCQAIRRTGSAALNLAYVACGRLNAHWARQICPWDVAAGVLLVDEAGGVVSSAAGGEFNVWEADFLVAGSPQLHAEMATVLSGSSLGKEGL